MWNIFKKEMLEVFRDKRTLFFMLLMPAIVIPALLFGYGHIAGIMKAKADARVLRYTVLAPNEYPILQGVLATEKRLEFSSFQSITAASQAIKNNQLDFILILNGDGEAAALKGLQPEVTLEYNDADAFDIVGRRIRPVIEKRYVEAARARRLQVSGTRPSDVEAFNYPFKFSVHSTAGAREKFGEVMGAAVPYILLLLGLTASTAVAIDIGAGEKERGTLESLLLLPVSRRDMVLAKFLLILLVATISGLIGLLSLGIGLTVMLEFGGVRAAAGLFEYIRLWDLVLVAMLMIPAFGIVSAILLVLSFFAKSHKEASSYANQLLMIVVLPILVAMLPGIRLKDGWSLVPVTNISLAIKEIIKGTIEIGTYMTVFGATLAVTAALVLFCVAWCKQEAVLFRS